MQFLTFLERTLLLVGTLVLVGQAYLNLYPSLRRCTFPHPNGYRNSSNVQASRNSLAPFRLLALGDPQLEGDSSLPSRNGALFQPLADLWTHRVDYDSPISFSRDALLALYQISAEDLPKLLKYYRKQLDLLGNDYYLGQIYRTLRRTTQPTHVTILGDLLGSQWISDEEFARRSHRFWHRVFSSAQKVEDEIMRVPSIHILKEDRDWSQKLINIAGNHDVGYAGDMTEERIQRFEAEFGKANWEVSFQLPADQVKDVASLDGNIPELRVVILNTMNMDSPAFDTGLQQDTYDFLNRVITTSRPVEDRSSATVLLTHLPLHKEAGVCVDGPMFTYWGSEYGGGVREQNHLSYGAGKGILEGLYGMSSNPFAPAKGMGRNGVILNGHDHEGCDTYHHISSSANVDDSIWKAVKWTEASEMATNNHMPGIREITVRSMMGDYGGNAGLLSAWFDEEAGEWRFEYETCPLGRQHIWWAVQVCQILGLFLSFYLLVLRIKSRGQRGEYLIGKKAGPPAEENTGNHYLTDIDTSTSSGVRATASQLVSRQRN